MNHWPAVPSVRSGSPGSSATNGTGNALERFVGDESGQDIVEYALLGALIGIAAILTWQQLATTVGVTYGTADAGVQGLSACTPDPGGGGC
jgi:Flp pilus assembly pilin Flp